ncbi:hypothetical protein JCM19275_1639 [Nonlabens ulvanivorans]|uniref:DUF1853 family protein n=1 Tax=Nonlabens ulvanivorans TaxID=906888 RepID=A0A090WFK3_NONUL|nr:DUF1853 family protein [Nonlabens ulvanivorans]GAL75756.1 hypothetical protein JCM19275_1639 [Nonlabens ulvanivorans]
MAQNDIQRFRAFLKTASLWNGKLAGVQQFPLHKLDLSHLKDDDILTGFPEIPVNTVLGKRAEYYYEYCIKQSLNYELIDSNIQINVAKITKGELDYLIREVNTNRIYHVELVYKFYCYDPDVSAKSNYLNEDHATELSKYVGPNKRDNFVFKFDRLVDHQLPLLYKPATYQALSSLNLAIDSIEQRVCYLAHVYIPRDLWKHNFKYINKRCIAGYYMNYDAFAKANTNNLYYLPKKHLWIGNCHALKDSYNYEETLLIVKDSLARGFAPMVWMQLESEEFESFFIIA